MLEYQNSTPSTDTRRKEEGIYDREGEREYFVSSRTFECRRVTTIFDDCRAGVGD